MKRVLTLIFALMLLFSYCSKNEEPAQQADRNLQPQDKRFATLSDDELDALLMPEESTFVPETLDKAGFNDVLNKVRMTPTDQVTENELAILETSLGNMAIAFYTDIAPIHTANFKRLVKSGFYNGTRFHRIMAGFMIQGGDILTRDDNANNDGTGGPGYTIQAEFNSIPHDLGILSMARAQDPNSAGSQFFICLSRNGTRSLDGSYTAFGKVVGGLDVVQALGRVPVTRSSNGENSMPVEPVYLKRAYMVLRK